VNGNLRNLFPVVGFNCQILKFKR